MAVLVPPSDGPLHWLPGEAHVAERDAVRAAVEQVYAAFSGYGLRHPVQGSPVSVSAADQELLASLPLRELGAEELDRYSFKALSTWGDEHDYRHFLPRLLELAVWEPNPPFISLDTISTKLRGVWTRWPEPEQHALCGLFEAVWRLVLCTAPAPIVDLDEVVLACARMLDIEPLLEAWRRRRDPAAVRNLAELVLSTDILVVRGAQLVVRDQSDDTIRRLALFLLDPETGAHLEQAWYDAPDAHWSDELALAVERLEDWARRSAP